MEREKKRENREWVGSEREGGGKKEVGGREEGERGMERKVESKKGK